ncbi:MAG: hypothetical protein ACYTEL_26480 [Planctomycetota bacterium]
MAFNPDYLRILFRDAFAKCLGTEGVNYPPVVNYVSDAFYDSLRSERFFVLDSGGRMLENPLEMFELGNRMRGVGDVSAEYDVRVGTGDYTLLTLGMFPKSRTVVSVGPTVFSDCGRYSYERAQEINDDTFGSPGETFTAMAQLFPRSVQAVNRMFNGGELLRTA